MSDVFISYSRADRFFAELLSLKLEANKIAVWRDKDQIRGGDDWREEIDVALENCKLILIVLSKSSANSGYVTYEWARAFGHGKASLQILIEECERHPRLQGPQYEDFTEKHLPWDTLIQNINERLDEAETAQDVSVIAEEQIVTAATEPEEPESEDIAGSPEHRRLQRAANEILGYLDSRGFQMVSNDRIREKLSPGYDDAFLNAVRQANPHLFRLAHLRDKSTGGTRRGLKKV